MKIYKDETVILVKPCITHGGEITGYRAAIYTSGYGSVVKGVMAKTAEEALNLLASKYLFNYPKPKFK